MQRFVTPAPLLIDGYKPPHSQMYPDLMSILFSTWTPRSAKIALQAERQLTHQESEVVFVGLHRMLTVVEDEFDVWFQRDEQECVAEYTRFLMRYYHHPADFVMRVGHIRLLHRLQRLPLIFLALPEGTVTNIGVVQMVVYNEPAYPQFAWLVNNLETLFSTELWKLQTSATIARNYSKVMIDHANITCDDYSHLPWQGHDFSMRGLSGVADAESSSMGHLLYFGGTDVIPALWAAEHYYADFKLDDYGTVPATEHSVACTTTQAILRDLDTTGGYRGLTIKQLNELYPDLTGKLPELTNKQLAELLHIADLLDKYQNGILSVVCDTWDFWFVLTNMLPRLKAKIMARNGKLVIRPDSGDPVKIICGDPDAKGGTPAHRGAINLLGDVFGFTINGKGFMELDPHIGLIYGDSITLQRAETIMTTLRRIGWASNVVVLGIGSYTYQATTRDVWGFAMKATGFVSDGEEMAIFKDPATDDGTKKSFRGFLTTIFDGDKYVTIDGLSFEAATNSKITAFIHYPVSRTHREALGINNWPQAQERARRGLVLA